MKELNFLEIIKKSLSDASYIGDDCAFLDELNLFVTQDTLVQDVHFSLYTTSAYLLGRKAVSVNLSDLAAALATPVYITVSLSMPPLTKDSFVSELYRGINDVCNEYGVKLIGGDITGGDKVIISICAIGKKSCNFLSSRKFAKKGDLILVTGSFGASAVGYHSLSNFLYAENSILQSHLNPVPRIKESNILAQTINSNIAVMDCSDGLVDALYKVSAASSHSLKIAMNKVPVNDNVKNYCKRNNLDYKKFVKWGGEDYELLICASPEICSKIDSDIFHCIGSVQNYDVNPSVYIDFGSSSEKINKDIFEKNSFDHFYCKNF